MNEDQMNLLEKELHAKLPYGIKGVASVKKFADSFDTTEWFFAVDVDAELVAI